MRIVSLPLLGLIAGVTFTASNARGAIITGTDNQDGSWTIANTTIDFDINDLPFGLGSEDRVTFDSTVRVALINPGLPPIIAYRRDAELTVGSSQTEDALPIYSDFVASFGAGAQLGSDNYLLLSLERGQSDWDTVIQFNFDNSVGLVSDNIIGIWHDDSSSGENILANISRFSELESLVVPEPSKTLFFSLASLGFLSKQRR